jgi:putative flippase GtrA
MSTPQAHTPGLEFGRYFAASLVALAVDVAILFAAAQVVHYLVAATLGFVAGSVVSYLLATRWAFRQRRFDGRAHAEFAVYALVGVFGLGINDLVMYLAVGLAGAHLLLAKLLAAGTTFFFNFAIRKRVLF